LPKRQQRVCGRNARVAGLPFASAPRGAAFDVARGIDRYDEIELRQYLRRARMAVAGGRRDAAVDAPDDRSNPYHDDRGCSTFATG